VSDKPHSNSDPTLPPADPGATMPPKTEPWLTPDAGAEAPRMFGRYRIEKELGRGGMGAVFLAHDTHLGRPVALKIPFGRGPSESVARTRFIREAQAAAALHHPHICPIFDVGEVDGTPFITMAFIRGEPLTKRIGPGKQFDPSAAAALVRQLALALHEAHRLGVIHRDLKPGNIMIDERGEAIVMDFGLARRADLAGGQLTQQGEIMGTPAYMPPEQMLGEVAMMGPASDVYSLGVILFELLTGDVPFHGDLLSLVSQVTLDDPPPPSRRRPGLDHRCDLICLRALAKKPDDRFESMQTFADALFDLCREPLTGVGGQPSLTPLGASITLRIEGTPFAYRPLPHQTIVSVGRQRRKLGEPDDTGNDVVLRVPGHDDLSTRISRRHLEIHRSGDQFFVTDRSKVGTHLNNVRLPRDVPTPLQSGDRLRVADVLILEVILHSVPTVRLGKPQVNLTSAAGQVIFEATLGDMVTTG
jgi:serine/threonine protein kinase